MIRYIFIISLITILVGCSDTQELLEDGDATTNSNITTTRRLNFENEISLEKTIAEGKLPENEISTRGDVERFISMMDKVPGTRNSDEEMTYYETLGFDSLVPNTNFAQLFNVNGELEVGKEIIRVTPVGTYLYPIHYEAEFNEFIKANPNHIDQNMDDDVININEYLTLYRTFKENPDDYEVISEGDYEELPDDYFGDDDDTSLVTRAVPEPNFSSFQTFSADRKTFVGKLIQNIIGSNKASTVEFNSKRRLKGSFYFYNYGVYAEIGVKGWTDKKNWIGWSKKESDELRIGWKNVILKKDVSSYYKEAMKKMKNTAYQEPQYTYVNGQRINVATLIMPDFKPTFKDELKKEGAKVAYDLVKSLFGKNSASKADGIVVATPDEIYFVSGQQDKVFYKYEYHCHVFSATWMEFQVGWSNTTGFSILGVNKNNYDEFKPYVKIIGQAFNEKRPTLISGEVYVCARFDNDWRGMRIVKK